MLVLTRKKDETIRIGQDIEITVIRVRGNSVRLGIKAPQDVRVVRGELKPNPPSSIGSAKRENAAPTISKAGSSKDLRQTQATNRSQAVGKTSSLLPPSPAKDTPHPSAPHPLRESHSTQASSQGVSAKSNPAITRTKQLNRLESLTHRESKTNNRPPFPKQSQSDRDIRRKIIVGRTKRNDHLVNVARGPLSEYLENL